MKAGSLILATVLLLALAAPAVCAVVLLLMFLLVAVGNASCIWREIRHKEHHSLVPLVGGLCGCFGLWLASTSDRLSGLHLPSGAWLAGYYSALRAVRSDIAFVKNRIATVGNDFKTSTLLGSQPSFRCGQVPA